MNSYLSVNVNNYGLKIINKILQKNYFETFFQLIIKTKSVILVTISILIKTM